MSDDDGKQPDKDDAASPTSPVHLGFCEPIIDPINDSTAYKHIGHISPHWSDWDGGQVGGRPSWLQPRDLMVAPLQCTRCGNSDCTNEPAAPGQPQAELVSSSSSLRFVCQLYAPADTVNPNAFHRTLYVFACPSCSAARVFRTQLAQDNDFFPRNDDDDECCNEWKRHLPETHGITVCKVCGQKGKGKCPIQKETFCGKQHQKEYMRQRKGMRRDPDKQAKDDSSHFVPLPSVYPMNELVVEEEPLGSANENVEQQHTTETRAALFEPNGDNDSDEDLEQQDLNAMLTGGTRRPNTRDDAITDYFFARVQRARDQCIRYHQWPSTPQQQHAPWSSSPLWLQSTPMPKDIPNCPYCGAQRKFEFQLMPQLLHYLEREEAHHSCSTSSNDDYSDDKKKAISNLQKEALLAASSIVEKTDPSELPTEFKQKHDEAIKNAQSKLLSSGSKRELDWGVVVVYTCTASCGGGGEEENVNQELGGAYREEYAFVQPSLG